MKRLLIGVLTALFAISNSFSSDCPNSELAATMWWQKSNEYDYLARQTYTAATLKLDTGLIKKDSITTIKRTVVLDIDETVLKNTGFRGRAVYGDLGYQDSDWNKWILEGKPKLLPGVQDFIASASAKKYKIFFVTNRKCSDVNSCPEQVATFNALRNAGLETEKFGITLESVLMKQSDPEDSTKEKRYRRISKEYEISMILGDDLNDLFPNGIIDNKALNHSIFIA